MKHSYNTFYTVQQKACEVQVPREMRKDKRGRPRKERVPSLDLPAYVKDLENYSGHEITNLVCKGIVDPKYIKDWAKFTDLDKARIIKIEKYNKYFFEFRFPFVSEFSGMALAYLISHQPMLAKHIHTLNKLTVAEWEYVLKKKPILVHDCPCREELSLDVWAHIIQNYAHGYSLFNDWDKLTQEHWLSILEKRPNYVSKFCHDSNILRLVSTTRRSA